ncbi:MAG: acetyl/propionyl/methylcrotonyl-CoA carboxylase subunit alpha [Steroidobacteraceae bacterium]
MREFRKILIANRGEIAVRVARTARDLGYGTVAVFSDADADALHVAACDEAVHIGASPALESYLKIERIIEAARKTGADAIHPGYGFLSENSAFAQACDAAGITFIGPPVEAIHLMGSKRLSKIAMHEAGVPCVPGYNGPAQDDDSLMREAERLGLPLMVKASAGGGGRGMRLVTDRTQLLDSIRRARSEAASAFGSDELILERAVLHPRHIEIQVFGDQHGHYLYLGERDCSIQRRHQKVVEEAPSPFMTAELRRKMGEAAIAAARRCSYVGAGTVEFLVDADRQFYFLEMNTRLQVEHPVTELVTGLDLVEWQLRVAAGEPLPLPQEQIELRGHAIEVRLYAEDPRNNFLPQTGLVQRWRLPQVEGLRVDTGIREGQAVSAFYDPMLAKVMAHGPDRRTAARRLAKALEDLTLFGVTNNRAFLAEILRHPAFLAGQATTAFIEQHMGEAPSLRKRAPDEYAYALAALLFFCQGSTPFSGWSAAQSEATRIRLTDDEEASAVVRIRQTGSRRFEIAGDSGSHEISVEALSDRELRFELDSVRAAVHYQLDRGELTLDWQSRTFRFRDTTLAAANKTGANANGELKAPMDGSIVAVLRENGTPVKAGEAVLVIEAMKMETQLRAPFDGMVSGITVSRGHQVKTRQVLAKVIATEAAN